MIAIANPSTDHDTMSLNHDPHTTDRSSPSSMIIRLVLVADLSSREQELEP